MSILVTGANGFVGSALCQALAARALPYTGAVRSGAGRAQVAVGAITAATDWRAALAGSHTVIHLAARVHVMNDNERDPLAAFRAMNVHAALNLARQAADLKLKRFIFVSSIKVNGEQTGALPFAASDAPAPGDPYGVSKMEAEQALLALGRSTGLEVVIVRPPLVYGPAVGANFLKLMQLAKSGLPLPLGAVDNRRSMVAVDNLVDLLLHCVHHPAAPGQVFLASDGHDVSTAQLVTMLRAAMGQGPRLISVPPALLRTAAAMLGKSGFADRLLSSLQVDIEPTKATLGWHPPVPMPAAIARTVSHFLTPT